MPPIVWVRACVCTCVSLSLSLYPHTRISYVYIGGWGGESAAAPTGESWRSKGVIELQASLGAMDLRIRRQIWHAVAVFIRAIDLATFEREAAEEEEEEDELSE